MRQLKNKNELLSLNPSLSDAESNEDLKIEKSNINSNDRK